LRETWKRHSQLEVWSHIPIQVDEVLSGVPDYLIARKSPRGFQHLEIPLLAIVEAKREDFITGWGQCLAAMVAAQKLNSGIEPSPVISIYNAKGQMIHTISLGTKQAGVYITKDRAAYWDGNDSFGQPVASGVYFYTLQVDYSEIPRIGAGEFRTTRRMVIMK